MTTQLQVCVKFEYFITIDKLVNFLKLAKIRKNMSLIDFNEVEKFSELTFWNQ